MIRAAASVLAAAALWSAAATAESPHRPAPGAVQLAVPVVRQAPERCGPAALGMVLRWYGAGPAALARADRAYDPALRGTLVTDLVTAAREAGFSAALETLDTDSLRALLARGVPPVVLYQAGPAPLTRAHYAVVTGWDPAHRRFTLNDGGAHPRAIAAGALERRWRAAGGQALIVTPSSR